MLEISHRNGSYANPLVGPRLVSSACQTEADGTSLSERAVEKEANSKLVTSAEAEAATLKPIPSSSTTSASSPSCTSPRNSSGSSLIMNGAIQREDTISPQRPLSSASEESESSISEDEEISFNTIKRQVRRPELKAALFCDEAGVTSNSAVNNSTSKLEPTALEINDQKLESVIQRDNGDLVNGAVLAEAVKEDNNNGLNHHHDNDDNGAKDGLKEPSAEGDDVKITSGNLVKKFVNNDNNSKDAIIESTSS